MKIGSVGVKRQYVKPSKRLISPTLKNKKPQTTIIYSSTAISISIIALSLIFLDGWKKILGALVGFQFLAPLMGALLGEKEDEI